ncbi:MAG: response regulator transcription factor [Spirochaetales bacterium]|nr:response regulator transcription factor [Spirochaetales bacterium]
MKKTAILVVEDDKAILTGLCDLLGCEGYEVFSAEDGIKGLEAYRNNRPDLILLDIMMPGKSGYDVLREIRKTDTQLPVLLLTAKGQEIDKVVGLELGADDYIVKPFGIKELLARIKAALRRSRPADAGKKETHIRFDDVVIDLKNYTCEKKGKKIQLSQKEIQLIDYLCNHKDEVIDRNTLLEEIWGVRYEGTTRTLDQHIAQLRKKIEDDPAHPKHLVTVHAVGYKFTVSPD